MQTVASASRLVLQPLLLGIALALLVRLLGLQLFFIPSASMTPTLQPGDQIVVTRYGNPFSAAAPERGDVIVFRRDGAFYVKRVIGLPGDHVEIRNGRVRIDGHAVYEHYIHPSLLQESSPAEILPSGTLFVLGDFRDDSIDSRIWGPIDAAAVAGKARWVVWSIAPRATSAHAGGTSRRHSAQSSIRWDRFLRPIE
jgi:signal peptidase I